MSREPRFAPRRIRALLRRAWPALGLCWALSGCARTGTPPPPAVSGPLDESTLLTALRADRSTEVLEGRGLLRVEAGDESVPGLNARFVVSTSGGGMLQLRPGVLPPVLNLWAGTDSWILLLPRQKLFSQASPGRDPSGDAAALGRLASGLFAPQAMAADLLAPSVLRHDGQFILRGHPASPGSIPGEVEVVIDARTLAVSRWSLLAANGESLVRVAYEPPLVGPDFRGAIFFLLPALDIRGSLEIRELRPAGRTPSAMPVPPPTWQSVPPDDLPDVLRSLASEGG